MTSYFVIGGGRVARHFQSYLALESIPFQSWTRQDGEPPLRERAVASGASHFLILISDSSINDFLARHAWLKEKTCVHMSGALVSPHIPSAHPLMTFGETLYDLETYRRIPFVIEEGRGTRDDLLPGLVNPVHSIPAQLKPLYHALCVLSGNFTTLLWEKAFADFSSKLGLPKSVLLPYLQRITQNLIDAPQGASVLTGPLKRGDQATLDSNLNALANDPFAEVYRAFVNAHRTQHKGGAV